MRTLHVDGVRAERSEGRAGPVTKAIAMIVVDSIKVGRCDRVRLLQLDDGDAAQAWKRVHFLDACSTLSSGEGGGWQVRCMMEVKKRSESPQWGVLEESHRVSSELSIGQIYRTLNFEPGPLLRYTKNQIRSSK